MRKVFAIFALLLLMLSSVSAQSEEEETPSVYWDDEQWDDSQCDCPMPPYRPQIDVVFLIDSTGSMADEIRSVKIHIVKIVKDVMEGRPSPRLRVGVVTYRDHEREERQYLLRKTDLTYNVDKALDFLEDIEARGGGDHPEAVADGLHEAINDMNWDKRARKLIFLIGDAAPHGEGSSDRSYEQGCPEGHDYVTEIKNARAKDIRIYTISGSGMDSVGVRIWREIAKETGGQYERLSYVRQDVDQYYTEEGVDPVWIAEAKKDADYDTESNSILTNSLGKFAKSAMISEAMEIGVEYDEEESESGIDYDNLITDEVVEESDFDIKLTDFFRRVFEKIVFWK
ncbi:MAG: VWA domain-containing protein [Nanoarchaeota archaeon]|nr:VWA domain-containing protein [DPANN group archaeon]MBL7116957.1 VWA domain-containing protein [Nanoarchaeota archaeon]